MEYYLLSVRNYAIYLNEQKRQVEALHFLGEVAKTLGRNHGLEDIASMLLGNAVILNLRGNQIEEARAILEDERLRVLVSEDFLTARRKEIMRHELEITVKGVKDDLSFHVSLTEVNKALATDVIDVKRWEELTVFLWTKETQRKAVDGDWLAGWLFLETAPESVRVISGWDSLEATYEYNATITYHNRFVTALRQRRIDTANRILNEGLELFPDSSILIADKKLLAEQQ